MASNYNGQKKSAIKPNVAPRFHGAFTGGFSAGYFNTVGSEEGFKPRTFVSSRTNRASRNETSAKDFMDVEDGLLGGSLASHKEYDTFDKQSKIIAEKMAQSSSRGSVIPGAVPSELIVLRSTSIGKQLLTKMGWREGQGVGSRTTAPSHLQNNFNSQVALEDETLTFAPKNQSNVVKIPPPKDDAHGIGYDIAIENPEMARFAKSSSEAVVRSVYRMGDVLGRGKAAHVGLRSTSGFALYDDDDDVYDVAEGSGDNPLGGNQTMLLLGSGEDKEVGSGRGRGNSKVNERLVLKDRAERDDDDDNGGGGGGGDGSAHSRVDRWLNGDRVPGVSATKCPSDGRLVLIGFVLSSKPSERPKYLPPPAPPPDFEPFHKFEESLTNGAGDRRVGNKGKKVLGEAPILVAQAREGGEGMGEKDDEGKGSVFSMLGAAARAQIDQAILKAKCAQGPMPGVSPGTAREGDKISDTTITIPPPSAPAPAYAPPALPTERPMLTSEALLKSTFAGLSQAFKSRFVVATSADASTGPTMAQGLTNAKDHKQDAPGGGDVPSVPLPPSGVPGVSSVTKRKHVPSRITLTWIPAPLLCKRFNVAVPTGCGQGESGAAAGAPALPPRAREMELFESHVGRFITPEARADMDTTAVSSGAASGGDRAGGTGAGIALDVVAQELAAPKPPMSLFKSIFDASSSESDGDSNDDDDDGDDDCGDGNDAAQAAGTSSVAVGVSDEVVQGAERAARALKELDELVRDHDKGFRETGARNELGSGSRSNEREMAVAPLSSTKRRRDVDNDGGGEQGVEDSNGRPKIVFRKPTAASAASRARERSRGLPVSAPGVGVTGMIVSHRAVAGKWRLSGDDDEESEGSAVPAHVPGVTKKARVATDLQSARDDDWIAVSNDSGFQYDYDLSLPNSVVADEAARGSSVPMTKQTVLTSPQVLDLVGSSCAGEVKGADRSQPLANAPHSDNGAKNIKCDLPTGENVTSAATAKESTSAVDKDEWAINDVSRGRKKGRGMEHHRKRTEVVDEEANSSARLTRPLGMFTSTLSKLQSALTSAKGTHATGEAGSVKDKDRDRDRDKDKDRDAKKKSKQKKEKKEKKDKHTKEKKSKKDKEKEKEREKAKKSLKRDRHEAANAIGVLSSSSDDSDSDDGGNA